MRGKRFLEEDCAQWYQVTLDLPWPAFDRTHATELQFFVDRINDEPQGSGTIRFDQIEFSTTSSNPPANGRWVPLEDFNDADPGLDRFGGSVGAFSVPDSLFPTSFEALPAAPANLGRRFDFQAGYDFAGYYSILHGQPKALHFTFDADRFQYLRFKVCWCFARAPAPAISTAIWRG